MHHSKKAPIFPCPSPAAGTSMDSNTNDDDPLLLHVVMFPWLAMGHLIPFLELSKHLAQKGHRVSFVSTPRNLQRLPQIPPNLSPLINLVTVSLPHVDNLPENAESSTDIPIHKSQLLKKAFDGLQPPLTNFLQGSNPDWIVYDYASYWLPGVAAKLHIPCAYFCLFAAAKMAFVGPPSVMLSEEQWPVDLTAVPSWIPFPSNIMFRPHEVLKIKASAGVNESGVSDYIRFGKAICDGDVVVLRSSVEFESDCLSLLEELYEKPVIPIGFLPPSVQDDEKEGDPNSKWGLMKEWLDKQEEESVVYVALGSEAALSREEIKELARGLERSELPFFWVIRRPLESVEEVSEMLPEDFEERIRGRGFVYLGWAPQVKILSHRAVGGFLTHCGWNSVIEGLGFGRALILFPQINDQGLNARLLQGKKLGWEIPRNEGDGSFTSESVAESMRAVMVKKEGELMRINAKEMKEMFVDNHRNHRYLDRFVRYLKKHSRQD